MNGTSARDSERSALADETRTSAFLLVGAVIGMVGGFIHFLATLAPEMLPFSKKPFSKETGQRGKDQSGKPSTSSSAPEHEPRNPS